MNYEKKRKRQSGRQAKKVQDCYGIWIDEEGNIHSKLYKRRYREDYNGFVHMKSVTKEEFVKDFT